MFKYSQHVEPVYFDNSFFFPIRAVERIAREEKEKKRKPTRYIDRARGGVLPLFGPTQPVCPPPVWFSFPRLYFTNPYDRGPTPMAANATIRLPLRPDTLNFAQIN